MANKTYLISYDLQKNADYTKLYEAIKTADGWWHYLESFWIISSSKTLDYWRDFLRNEINSGDRFIVIEISEGKTDGWLPQDAWDWIKKNTCIK